MRRGIAFLDVLAVIGVCALILAIVTPPLAATSCYGGTRTAQLSNVRMLATGAMLYLGDWGDGFMLSAGRTAGTAYSATVGAVAPADQSVYGSLAQSRLADSREAWANSLQPYVHSYDILSLPVRGPRIIPTSVLPSGSILEEPERIGVTYNGLLHSYLAADIVRPSRLPMFWSGLGRAEVENVAYSSPGLTCEQPLPAPCRYVPSAKGCTAKQNGQTSTLLTPQGSLHVYERGMHIAYVDSHAKFVSMGERLLPGHTDPTKDPFTGYYDNGRPRSYWWDGCHPWFFRPDHDFEEVGP